MSFIFMIILALSLRLLFWFSDILTADNQKVSGFLLGITGFFVLNWLIESTFQLYGWFQ